MRQARSAKGEIVDFDMLAIKSQMNAVPKSQDVSSREKFIDQRMRRRPIQETEETVVKNDVSPNDTPPINTTEESTETSVKKRKPTTSQEPSTGDI